MIEVDKGGQVIEFRRPRQSKFDRLFEEAQEIEAADAFQTGQVGYINRVMVQATLPYREPKGSPPIWGRRAGNWSLVIQPGMYLKEEIEVLPNGKTRKVNAPASMGYPYGATPRLVLAWLGGEIKRQQQLEIKLGKNLTAFLQALGVENPCGGKRGTIGIAREQMRRLFSSRIALIQTPNPSDINWSMDGMQIADHQLLWWNDKNTEKQDSLFESTVTLSQKFFDEFNNHGVPLDMRALRALRQSPLELDLYSWLAYRLFILQQRTTVPWEAIQAQFGSSTRSEKKFRWQVRAALKNVLAIYPKAKVDASAESGLVLYPSTSAIRRLPRSEAG